MSRSGKFEIFKSLGEDNNNYYFRLKAGNGKIILRSEAYSVIHSARQGIRSVIRHSNLFEPDEYGIEIRKSKFNTKKPWYFVVKAKNGEVVGISQMYSRKYSAQKGVKSVMKNTRGAEVVMIDLASPE